MSDYSFLPHGVTLPKSQRQERVDELKRRRELKAQLVQESEGLCMTCHRRPDWRGLDLVHIKDLSDGGKTTRENCTLECRRCHNPRHHKKEME